jgi:hypothetical protein
MTTAYEIHNPSFNDIPLDKQIEYGINDWAVDGKRNIYVGQTAAQAVEQFNIFEVKTA